MVSSKLLFVIWCCVKIVHSSVTSPIVYLPTEVIHSEQEQFNASRSGRVAGGTDAPAAEFPYVVELHLQLGNGWFYQCAGTLISQLHILSADHCLSKEVTNIDAHLGVSEWGGPDHEVHPVAWYIRRGYGTNPYVDLMIMGLGEPVTVKPHIAPIALPRLSQVGDFFLNRDGIISGYGGVDDGKLKQIPVKFVPSNQCGTSIDILCSVGRDGPQQRPTGADAGGPVVMRTQNGTHVLVGISGFTYGDNYGATHVPQFLSWIHQMSGIPIPPRFVLVPV